MSNYKKLVDLVDKTCQEWLIAFNNGDAAACASFYEEDAILYGIGDGLRTYEGRADILTFWELLINTLGLSNLSLSNINMYVHYVKDDPDFNKASSVVLSASWGGNIANGVLHNELWVVQNGVAKIRYDSIQVTGSSA